jgi:hypothetical protein
MPSKRSDAELVDAAAPIPSRLRGPEGLIVELTERLDGAPG